MKLSHVRRRLTLLYGIASALAVVTLAVMAIRASTDRLAETADRALDQRVTALLTNNTIDNPPTDQGDAWYVDTATGRVVPAGPTQLEPPLQTLAKAAIDQGEASESIAQGGDHLRLMARPVPNTPVAVVVAASRNDIEAAQRSVRLRIGLVAGSLLVVTSLIGYLLAGRSLRPAREAMERQQDFLANAAHEIRTPLAVIQASASQALSRERTVPEYARALAEIRSAAERAATGVGEMLDLARLDAGRAVPRMAPLRLDLLVEEVAGTARDDHCTVEVTPSEAVLVNADLSLLRQAVDNLVINAVKRATHVQVSVRQTGKNALVEVSDDGPGVPREMLTYIFERFHRGDTGGTGLGLAIVRSIAEAHGGRVEAANGTDGGAVFRVLLPRLNS